MDGAERASSNNSAAPGNARVEGPMTSQLVMARQPSSPRALSTARARVLVVDDAAVVRHTVASMLDAIVHVVQAASLTEAEELLDHGWEAIVVDERLPDGSGVAWAERVRQRQPQIELVVVSGLDDAEVERRATSRGMFFASKPRGYPVVRRVAEMCAERVAHRAERDAEPRRVEPSRAEPSRTAPSRSGVHLAPPRVASREPVLAAPEARARLLVLERGLLGHMDLRAALAPHHFQRVATERAARAALELLLFDGVVVEASSLAALEFARVLRDEGNETPALIVASDRFEEIAGAAQSLRASTVGSVGLTSALGAFATRVSAPMSERELGSAAARFGREHDLTDRQVEALVAWVPTRDYDAAGQRIYVTSKTVESQIGGIAQRTGLTRTEIRTRILFLVRRM